MVMPRRFRGMLRLRILEPKGYAVDSRFLTRPDKRLEQFRMFHHESGNCFVGRRCQSNKDTTTELYSGQESMP